MQKIIITGANGQLGMEFRELSKRYSQFEFVFLTREGLELSNYASVEEFLRKEQPSYLVNCAAYTAVDKAEEDKAAAILSNVDVPRILASICAQYNIKFIHISTDYVFDGNANRPYKESAETNPQGVYGASKLAGEQAAISNNKDSLVIRTAWVYSSYGKNFVKTMMRLMDTKEAISVVNDQWGAPTYAADLADAIMQILVSEKWIPGIYHFTNAGNISWYDFATAIRDTIGSSCIVNPISSNQYPTAAKRPSYSVLSTKKIADNYQVAMHDWNERLSVCIKNMQDA